MLLHFLRILKMYEIAWIFMRFRKGYIQIKFEKV